MKILKRHLPAAFLILACLLNVATARADEFHYNNMLIGERAAGMGGAFTALASDTSGMYYNPAGLVHAHAKSLSASVNAYYSLSKKYSGVIAGADLNRNYSAIVPNFFGVQQPVGPVSLGFSYAVPEHAFENMDETFTDLPTTPETRQHYGDPNLRIARYVLNLNTEDSINEFGPSVAVKVSDTMSLGLTLYVHKRDYLFIENELLRLSNGRDQWTNVYVKIREWGTRPILGFLWKPSEQFSFGAALSRTFVIQSDVAYQGTYHSTLEDPSVLDDQRVTSSEKQQYPWQCRLGVAYRINPAWLVSGDVALYPGFSYDTLGTRVERESVVNLALGTEYSLGKDWIFRGGVFTNRSNSPDITPDMKSGVEKIDMYGIAGSITFRIMQNSITVGGNYGQGSGTARITSDQVARDVSARTWNVFIASTYLY
jgi:long-chain fatty acid transport protein